MSGISDAAFQQAVASLSAARDALGEASGGFQAAAGSIWSASTVLYTCSGGLLLAGTGYGLYQVWCKSSCTCGPNSATIEAARVTVADPNNPSSDGRNRPKLAWRWPFKLIHQHAHSQEALPQADVEAGQAIDHEVRLPLHHVVPSEPPTGLQDLRAHASDLDSEGELVQRPPIPGFRQLESETIGEEAKKVKKKKKKSQQARTPSSSS